MGKRLIDADKLKRKCQKVATEAWKMKIKASAETIMNQFIDFIDEADIVDAVPSATDTNVATTDTISRAAAVALVEEVESKRLRGEIDLTYAPMLKGIKALPSAQPETAKRIVGKSRDGMTLWYQCDMCNEPVDAQDDFCRGCGRRLTDG